MAEQRRTRSDGRETIALIKKHALAELEKYGAINFNLDRVLETSGVSRSSVYHHFGSRDDLLAVVSLELALRQVVNELKIVEDLADAATTPAAMFDVLVIGLTAGATPQARSRRLRRVAGLAATESNATIHDAMRAVQVEGTTHFIRILENAKQRGLIKPSAPIRGIAYHLQSLLIGRIVVDMTDSQDIEREWLETSVASLRVLLGVPAGSK